MRPNRRYRLVTFSLFAGIPGLIAGCEGINRKHDPKVVDVRPPPADAPPRPSEGRADVNIADKVEDMMAARQAYLESIAALERTFLQAGDSNRADWARRQRHLTQEVLVYPYLTNEAPEQRVDVSPTTSIPEADALYEKGVAKIKEFRAVPLVGALPENKKKAREALATFKQVLSQYPTSDKVDDCAYWCGEIYKEYLREDDPDDELAIRYYKWAIQLDPQTPHKARFQLAVVYDFRRHNRDAALELYHEVLDGKDHGDPSNVRFAATRIEQLSDEDFSHLRPDQPRARPAPPEPKPDKSGVTDDGATTPDRTKPTRTAGRPAEPDSAP
jgi:tetratricopeptide (TPR) repeat protein